ncbi:MAG: toll/interleukin-1 receptor domain-containing protein [Clostridia bacterium]|nr:toll/interleukin-1 receptor domain-containing protein [Clostridia bacterium]
MNCLNCGCERLVYDKTVDSYKCLECQHEHLKQYFFISHSHLDIEKVRIVRNIIEETFFYEPILFFLKCLSDDNEIQDLIKREINERIWFVYCKSENAEGSYYVQKEREYLKALIDSGKKINVLEIELDKFDIWDKECYDYIRNQIAYQIRVSKVFLSYARSDKAIAKKLHRHFKERGYSVWDDDDLVCGDSWLNSVESQIKENSYRDGVFIFLVSKRSIQSKYAEREISYALSKGAFVLPVLIKNDVDLDDLRSLLDGTLSYINCPVIDINDFESGFEDILKALEAKELLRR